MNPINRNNSELPELPIYFDDELTRQRFQWSMQAAMAPNQSQAPANVQAHENGYVIEVLAPGFSLEDFKLEFSNGELFIRAAHELQLPFGNKTRFLHREFHVQPFERSFSLPIEELNLEKIDRRYEEGIFRLFLQKKKPPKRSSWIRRSK